VLREFGDTAGTGGERLDLAPRARVHNGGREAHAVDIVRARAPEDERRLRDPFAAARETRAENRRPLTDADAIDVDLRAPHGQWAGERRGERTQRPIGVGRFRRVRRARGDRGSRAHEWREDKPTERARPLCPSGRHVEREAIVVDARDRARAHEVHGRKVHASRAIRPPLRRDPAPPGR
jgi:hypothetical protein